MYQGKELTAWPQALRRAGPVYFNKPLSTRTDEKQHHSYSDHALSPCSVTLSIAFCIKYYYLHFSEEDMEAQRS